MFSVTLCCLMLQISGLIRYSISQNCAKLIRFGMKCTTRIIPQMRDMAKALESGRVNEVLAKLGKMKDNPCLSPETYFRVSCCYCCKKQNFCKQCKMMGNIWNVVGKLRCELRRKGKEISEFFPGLKPVFSELPRCADEKFYFPLPARGEPDIRNFEDNNLIQISDNKAE